MQTNATQSPFKRSKTRLPYDVAKQGKTRSKRLKTANKRMAYECDVVQYVG